MTPCVGCQPMPCGNWWPWDEAERTLTGKLVLAEALQLNRKGDIRRDPSGERWAER